MSLRVVCCQTNTTHKLMHSEVSAMKAVSLYVSAWILRAYIKGKRLEVRLCSGKFQHVKEGDVLSVNELFLMKVVAVRAYRSVDDVLGYEDVEKIFPGMSKHQVKEVLADAFSEEEISLYGLVVFELEAMETGKGNTRDKKRKIGCEE